MTRLVWQQANGGGVIPVGRVQGFAQALPADVQGIEKVKAPGNPVQYVGGGSQLGASDYDFLRRDTEDPYRRMRPWARRA